MHELGHTIGIHHDFVDGLPEEGKGSETCKRTWRDPCCYGFMHYGNHKNYWSDCSVTEFHFNFKKNNWAQTCFKGNCFDLDFPSLSRVVFV